MTTKQIIQQRIRSSWVQASKILKIVVGSGGTPLVMGILLIGLYFSYRILLSQMPPDFPIDWMIIIFLALCLYGYSYRPWIQQADLVFLLPMEGRMKPFIRIAFIYSSSMALVRLAVIFFLLFPIYLTRVGTFAEWWGLVGLVSILQIWNLWMYIYEDFRSLQLSTWAIRGIRFLINGFILIFAIHPYHSWLGIALLVPILHSFWIWKTTQTEHLPWVLWKNREQKIVSRWRSMASWFVELRGIERPVHPRNGLIRFLKYLFPTKKPFSYLYLRTWIRRSDLYAIYFRLLIWAGILLISLPYEWVPWVILPLTIWLYGSQMPHLITHQSYPLWIKLYPISQTETLLSWLKLTRSLLISFTFLLAGIVFLLNRLTLLPSLLLLVVGCLLSIGIPQWEMRSLQAKTK